MTSNALEEIARLKEMAIDTASGLQPWDGYYRYRAKEMEVLFSIYNIQKVNRILEIGCGNGFISAILSRFADEVIAVDLSKSDAKTHSIGIVKTSELFEKLRINNCSSVSCSGEKLPFKDGTFDFVFCAYTLEHIPDRIGALREVKRVLKDGAETVFILPTFMHWIFYPSSYYFGLAKRGMAEIFKRKKHGFEAGAECKQRAAVPFWRRIRKNYPHFPLLEPHGAYSGFLDELMNYRVHSWLRIFAKSTLKVDHIFSTILIPREIIGLFTEPLSYYENHSWIDKKFGAKKFFKSLGQNVCIVAKNSV